MPIGVGAICTESELDTVFPQYLTFAATAFGPFQSDGRGVALMHKSMALLKSYITSRYTDHNGNMSRDVKVYEVVRGKAHLLYDLPHGSAKKDSELWSKKPSQRAIAIDEDEVAAALESIQRSIG